ncbi:YbaK/EbsC family protein [bacterium]|nr:YbaK/EbsC family protein [bacterium]
MPINKKILKLLTDNNIKNEIINHRKVYTAFDASQTLKVKPQEIAKSLIIKIKRDFYMVILGANKNIDFKKIAKKLKINEKDIKIPSEKILINKFKIKPGSAHVFANIYKIPIIIDKSFSELKTAIFSSGSFTESIKMKLKDYIKFQEPEIFIFGKVKKFKIQKTTRPPKLQRKGKPKKKMTKKVTKKKTKKTKNKIKK